MYGFEGVGLSGVQLSISELSVVDLGGGWTGQTHIMVGHGRGPTNRTNFSHLLMVRAEGPVWGAGHPQRTKSAN